MESVNRRVQGRYAKVGGPFNSFTAIEFPYCMASDGEEKVLDGNVCDILQFSLYGHSAQRDST